ncbi:oligosaccharide flippase family protein [Chryseobacterium populi]|uniref:Membrane protein involved in the export of O-antigen and teichoic acid n=1 Tax=Chryseobacterium populi TaxID=1144316 RepID=J3CKY4_9FLAO|nr:oligosaccharide flippase family protein [Chryseobacterium populi]EJL73626.1 membrane protein involved in the export of O-antigen and teichoic acid [Chryseobacterium populi]
MKSLKDFLRNFFNNSGHYVFLSFLIAKICGFAGSLLIIRLLPEKEFGILSIALSVVAIFLPFTGFGSSQSLMRYGSIASGEDEKQKLSSYFFFKGIFFEMILLIVFLTISLFYLNKYEDIFLIFVFCTIRLGGFYFVNHIQSFYRITAKNQTFARISNVTNIGGLLLILILTYFFKVYGYLIAIAITPYLSLFWLKKDMYSFSKFIPGQYKEYWSYGMFTAATSLISDTLFSLDILLLGFFSNESMVANYRVAILIPSNITFLAISFMQSDFPVLSKNYQNKSFLTSYLINFHKIFLPVCAGIFIFFYLFKSYILQFFFGETYMDNTTLFMILLTGFNLGMLTRNLYGNLLPAVGKIEINTWISLGSLILLSVMAYILIPMYGVIGMGIAMSFTILISGIAYLFFFFLYLKKLS